MAEKTLSVVKFVLFVALLLLSSGCTAQQQSFYLSDLSAPASFTIRSSEKNVTSLLIQGDGYVDGQGTLSLYLDGQPYRSEKLWGDISIKWNGDWYSDSAQLVYQPATASCGHLTLKYSFLGTGSVKNPTFPAERTYEGAVMQNRSEFLATEWHRKKWQESPAIINISQEEIRLLFNRPEKLFQLRRAQLFVLNENYEYRDDKMSVTYRIERLEPTSAHISYECKSADGQTATGSFQVEVRGE